VLGPGAVVSVGRLVSLMLIEERFVKTTIIPLHGSSSRKFQQRFIVAYFKHIEQKEI
jgi:hypothetical protein